MRPREAEPRLAFERRTALLVGHLTAREFRIRYHPAILGWVWAIAPTMARVLVLGVLFSSLLPNQSEVYVAELAVGLLGWSWFSSGVSNATRSAVDRRDLLAQPGVPRQVVPVVSVLTDAFDYLAALPLLLVIVYIDAGGVSVEALLFPFFLALQGALVLGVGMAASVADVRFRDARLAVDLVLALGFYATPVFYTREALPADLRYLLDWNPMAHLLEAQRDVLIYGTVPSAISLGLLTVVCLAVLTAGWHLHRRKAATFLDWL
ncbi:MAG: ABC transporter permease [Actinomycetota bacterium]|nr:ABC transporter permease [Actinomycetota bacterium]